MESVMHMTETIMHKIAVGNGAYCTGQPQKCIQCIYGKCHVHDRDNHAQNCGRQRFTVPVAPGQCIQVSIENAMYMTETIMNKMAAGNVAYCTSRLNVSKARKP